MYVPIERLKEIVPQQCFSVIYLVNDCGHQHQYAREYYFELRCPESLLTNDFHVDLYIVLFLTRLVFLLFLMICNKMHPNSLNLREHLGVIQDICMPELTSTLALEGSRS
jgi:hypothetical protein